MADDKDIDADEARISNFLSLDESTGRIGRSISSDDAEDDDSTVLADAEDEEDEEDGPSPSDDDEEDDPSASGDDDDDDDGDNAVDKDAATDETDDDKPKPKKKKLSAKDRINQAIKRQRDAERRAAEAEERARAAEALRALDDDDDADSGKAAKKAATVEVDLSDLTEPDPKDKKYEFGEVDPQYRRDVREYDREVLRRQIKAEATAESAAAAQAEEDAKRSENWDAQVLAGIEKYDDFETVVVEGANERKWPLSAELGQMIAGSEHGADIAHHLATNLAEARRVYGSSAMEQAAYFGRMEARFASEAKKSDGKKDVQVSKAPSPPRKKPRGKGGKFKTSPATTDFAAFRALAMAESDER